MTTPIIAERLTKTYDELAALNEFSFTARAGQLIALVGHNGSGKSTFLRLAAGLLEPTDGQVRIGGAPAGSLDARAELSFIPDEPVLYDDLSVREHIEYIGRLHGVDDWPELGDELVDALGLTERADDLPARFSRGLRQKTSLVLGLVRPFSVLAIDEPFVGLDPAGQVALTKLLVDRARGGASVIVATHQLEFLEHADRCVGLRDGAAAFSGPVDLPKIRTLLG